MAESNLIDNAIKQKNQDESKRLEMKKKSIDSQFLSAKVNDKTLLYEEANRIANEINESKGKECKE